MIEVKKQESKKKEVKKEEIKKEEVKKEKVVLNLYQKLVEVRKTADGFSKDTVGYGYKYVSGNQVLGKIKDKMNELNLLLVPSTEHGEHYTYDYTTEQGKEKTDFVISGKMHYTWIDGDSPEDKLSVEWDYYGQNSDLSQAFGSALTYSERYFLLKFLGLPTDEADPDAKDEGERRKVPSRRDEMIKYLAKVTVEAGYTIESVLKKYNKSDLKYLKNEEINQTIVGFENIIKKKESIEARENE